MPSLQHVAGPVLDGLDAFTARVPAVAFQNLVGRSAELRRAIAIGCRVASHRNATVLIEGETGTGKELFARGIHYSSDAASDPFVAINCAAIPENLLESELFGHERGAFSGAVSAKAGLFEVAGAGTVFLDEIGELPLNLQPKLLRALESRKARRIGGIREVDIRCRVIAATNRDLKQAAADGTFREDLYYRLNVVRLELPPLRERRGDVEQLAEYFVDQLCREYRVGRKRLTEAALELLRSYDWPGNVRELKNALEAAVVLADGPQIREDHIRIKARPPRAAAPETGADGRMFIEIGPTGLTLEEAERQLIEATLVLANGNQSRAARMLGISRSTLFRKFQRFRDAGLMDGLDDDSVPGV